MVVGESQIFEMLTSDKEAHTVKSDSRQCCLCESRRMFLGVVSMCHLHAFSTSVPPAPRAAASGCRVTVTRSLPWPRLPCGASRERPPAGDPEGDRSFTKQRALRVPAGGRYFSQRCDVVTARLGRVLLADASRAGEIILAKVYFFKGRAL